MITGQIPKKCHPGASLVGVHIYYASYIIGLFHCCLHKPNKQSLTSEPEGLLLHGAEIGGHNSCFHQQAVQYCQHKTHTHTHNRFTALWILSGTTRVSRYQKKHSPTHSSWSSNIPISFLHLVRSVASSLLNPRTLQSFSTISLQVFFGLPHGLAPSNSYSIPFFTQSLSSFRSTCPYHRNLFCCSTKIMSSNPSLLST